MHCRHVYVIRSRGSVRGFLVQVELFSEETSAAEPAKGQLPPCTFNTYGWEISSLTVDQFDLVMVLFLLLLRNPA